MAKYAWPAGSTSKTVVLFIQDSTATTGAGRVSLSAGNLNTQEIRVLTSGTVVRTTISCTNLSSLDASYLKGGIFPVDPTNCPGWYRFDIPDTALSTGAVTAAVSIIGSVSSNNVAQVALEIQLQNSPVDVITWNGTSVSASYLMPVTVRVWDQTSVSSSNLATLDKSSRVLANVDAWAGVSVTASTLLPVTVRVWDTTSVSSSNVAVTDRSTRLAVNVEQWHGNSTSSSDIVLRNEISLSVVNVTQWAGTSVTNNSIVMRSTSATLLTSATVAGSVDVGTWGGVTVSASNFTTLGADRVWKADIRALAGTSVTASTLFPVRVRMWGSEADEISVSASNIVTTASANIVQWAGITVSASILTSLGTTKVMKSDVVARAGVSVTASTMWPANVIGWAGASVTTSTLLPVTVRVWDTTSVSSSNLATLDKSSRVNADVGSWAGTSVTNNSIVMRTTSATLIVDVLAWAGTAVATARPLVNAVQWDGTSTGATNIALRTEISLSVVNVTQWAGTSVTNNSIVMRSTSATLLTSASVVGSVDVATWKGVTVSASNAAIQNIPQANLTRIKGDSITGSGTSGNPWGPA